MPTIRIKRKNEFTNRCRDIHIYINGKMAGIMVNGATKEFVVPSGVLHIKAHIDWCSSREITVDLSERESADLKLSGFKWGNCIIITALLSYLADRLGMDTLYVLLAALPGFLILLYYATLGRKKYLRLSEVAPDNVWQENQGPLQSPVNR